MTSHVSWLDTANRTVDKLLSGMVSDPSGQFTPSVYETGRLVTLTPSLPGHAQRVQYLLDEQHPDGSWGGPGNYDILPTLSATDALLSERHRPGASAVVIQAAERGLRFLANRLDAVDQLPDTVAVEILVPGLLDDINAYLERSGAPLLSAPESINGELLTQLRTAVAQGHALPEKLLHSLEVIGVPAHGAPCITPVNGQVVGCSPAATAVWLGDAGVRANEHPGVAYLRSVQTSRGGIPVAAPLPLFERAWVLSTLAGAGVEFTPPDTLVESLHSAFGADGAAGGLGLPPDADDTGTALYALSLLGSPRSPECLWEYESGDHFSCFPEERTPSTSTNAHVLQAIGAALRQDLPGRERYSAAAERVVQWLSGQQQPDGSWQDKWHASPYYATVCCAVALAEYGGDGGAEAVRKAIGWLLATQRAEGSWGHWDATVEETAYAVRTLLQAGDPRDTQIAEAAARGCAFLLQAPEDHPHPPLWHDKDLYTPVRVVQAEIFAALYLGHTDPHVAPLISNGAGAGAESTRR